MQYAVALGEYVEKEKIANLKVWTSELKRTKATARHVDAPVENWKALNEIDAVRQRFIIHLIQLHFDLMVSLLCDLEIEKYFKMNCHKLFFYEVI